ncbi:MAG TPA: hypothetical protein VL426_02200 [Candidatus Binatia bacterium]|nr:hypothetical protein [Candidatus Binatia bacterium]
MSPVAALFSMRLQVARTALRRSGWAQRAVAACFFAIGALLIAGAYAFFLRAFRFVLADELAGPLILRYILEVAFALVYFLGVSSFVVSSYSLIYKAEDLRLLVPMPIGQGALFLHRFAAATALSSWPVIVIAAPALAALGAALDASWDFAVFGVALAALFALAIAVTGGLLSFLLASLLKPVPVGVRKTLEAVAFFGLGAALVRMIVPRAVFGMFDVASAAKAAETGAELRRMFLWLPSHPFAAAAAPSLPYGGDASVASMLGFAAAVVAAGLVLLVAAAETGYLRLWQRYGETGFIAGPADRPSRAPLPPFPRLFRAGHSFLFEKDLLTFARDGEAVSRAGFMLLLLGMYLLLIRAISLAQAFQKSDLAALPVAFAFAAIGYFTLTLALRYVFPSISLEGRGAWLVWSSPIHAHEIFSWKFFFWAASLSAAMGAAAALVIALFAFPLPLAALFAAACVASAVTLSMLALGIGAFAPDFRAKDPDMIATSPAGLAATAVGAAYIFIMARYVHRAALTYLSAGTIEPLVLIGMSVVSLSAIAASWGMAMRSMDKMEIA